MSVCFRIFEDSGVTYNEGQCRFVNGRGHLPLCKLCLVSQSSFDQKDEELSPTLDPPSYFELGAPDV